MRKKTENSNNSVIRLLINYCEKLLLLLSGVSLVALPIIILYGIFGRIFGLSVIWTNELATYLMLFLVYLSAPWVLKLNGHVKVDILLTNLKERSLHINNLVVSLICMIVNGMIFWFSLKYTLNSFQAGTVLMGNIPMPQYIFFLPIVIGSLFLAIRFILNFTDSFISLSFLKNQKLMNQKIGRSD